MMAIRPVGYLEYMVAFAGCRMGLSDFYIKNQGAGCMVLGAFDECARGQGILIVRDTGNRAEIVYLNVKEEYRRRGIGRALLKNAADTARKNGGITAVSCRLKEGHGFYAVFRHMLEKAGFVIVEETELFRSYREDYGTWTHYMERQGYAMEKLLNEEGYKPICFAQASKQAVKIIRDTNRNGFGTALDPNPILDGYKGKFCEQLSFVSLKEGKPAAYCLVCQPDERNLIYEMISVAERYRDTGVIFQPFAKSVNSLKDIPYHCVGFAMHKKNKKALALTRRLMCGLVSTSDTQYDFQLTIKEEYRNDHPKKE